MKHYNFGKRKAPRKRRKQAFEIVPPPASPSSQGSSSPQSSPRAPEDDRSKCVWEKKSNVKGFTYFVNKVTGDTVWEKPSDYVEEQQQHGAWDEWEKNGLSDSKQVWESYIDNKSGHEYYHNPVTGENSWVVPAEATVVPGITAVDDADTKRSKKGNWELCHDKDGTPYYYNHKTGASAWDLSGEDENSSSGASSGSEDEEYDSSFDGVNDGDMVDQIRKSAIEIGTRARDVVQKLRPHAVSAGSQAWDFSKRNGALVAGASISGVNTIWGWVNRVVTRENLAWVQQGSVSMVTRLQGWVDEIAVDPDAGVEHLVNSASKHGEETVGWILGHDNSSQPLAHMGSIQDGVDIENNRVAQNGAKQTYTQITFKPSDLEKAANPAPSGRSEEPVEKVAHDIALEHGDYQSKKLGSSIDELSARLRKDLEANP